MIYKSKIYNLLMQNNLAFKYTKNLNLKIQFYKKILRFLPYSFNLLHEVDLLYLFDKIFKGFEVVDIHGDDGDNHSAFNFHLHSLNVEFLLVCDSVEELRSKAHLIDRQYLKRCKECKIIAKLPSCLDDALAMT